MWDSQSHPRQCNCTASENELKFLKSIRQPLFSSFGKSEDQRWILPLMGCQWKEIENLCQRIEAQAGLPQTLGLEEQGRFALGYYCQLAEYRARREEAEIEEKAEQITHENA